MEEGRSYRVFCSRDNFLSVHKFVVHKWFYKLKINKLKKIKRIEECTKTVYVRL